MAGLRIYDAGKIVFDVTSSMTMLVGSVDGNGSVSLPSGDYTYFSFSIVKTFNFANTSGVVVTFKNNQAVVSNSSSDITTYIGIY